MKKPKIAIIGAGAVGSHIAYALLLQNTPADICLIDKNEQLEEGNFLDLKDTVIFSESNILPCETKDAGTADIIIITAGAAQKLGETRTELTGRNIEIIRSIKQEIGEIKKTAIVIMVSNPVDILTQLVATEWGLSANQVLGTGTLLDTSRFRWRLAEKTGVHPSSVHGWVLGEHGQTEFIAWSTVNISGQPAKDLKNYQNLEEPVRMEAFEIIKNKGATYFGIGACTAKIVNSILKDTLKVFPLSVPLHGEYGIRDMAVGIPVAVGINGREKISEIPLTNEELQKLQQSANSLKEIFQKYQ